MTNLSEMIFNLDLSLKQALRSSGVMFNLREKLLFCLLEKPLPPYDILERLTINRPNLSHLCNTLLSDGLIEKVHDIRDLRHARFALTQKGKAEIDCIMTAFESRIKEVFKNDTEFDGLASSLKDVIEALSYM